MWENRQRRQTVPIRIEDKDDEEKKEKRTTTRWRRKENKTELFFLWVLLSAFVESVELSDRDNVSVANIDARSSN